MFAVIKVVHVEWMSWNAYVEPDQEDNPDAEVHWSQDDGDVKEIRTIVDCAPTKEAAQEIAAQHRKTQPKDKIQRASANREGDGPIKYRRTIRYRVKPMVGLRLW